MTAKPEPSSLDPDRLPREKQSGEQARYKIDLPTLLDRHDMIWGDPHGPPADWRAGAPIGNGDFGAMIYGYPDAMSFVLGKSDVWNRRNDDRSEFIGETFSEYSQTFFDNDEAGFEKLRNDAKPSYRKDSPHLTTCGRFVLHLEEAAIIASCTLRAHLREGSATLRWREPNTKTEARVLVSRRFEVLSVDIQRQGEAPAAQAIEWELSRARLPENPGVETRVDNGVCYLTQRFAAGGGYTMAATALSGECVAEAREGRLWGRFIPDAEGSLSVLLTIVSSGDAPDPEAEALGRLQRAKEAGHRFIAQDHSEWWLEYWQRGLACVEDQEVEKLYYTSLYLTASMLQAGKQSPGLQGIWVGENVPPWNADFHSNVNIQCVYWGLFTNNRLDLVEPYLRHYHRTADAARRDAREYFQMRGLRFPHGGSIGGYETTQPDYQTLGTDPSASSWVTQLFW